MGELAEETSKLQLGSIPFGKQMLKEFLHDPAYHNMNNGSFGTIPRHIQKVLRSYQDETEARPDPFIRWTYHDHLRESRKAVADIIKTPLDSTVFVPNATTGVNTVLRNLSWEADGLDEILYFSTIYGGCAKTIDYIVDTRYGRVSERGIPLTYPMEDADVVAVFRSVVAQSRAEGKRPKICLFDVVTSLPGICFPWVAMTAACRELGVMSLVDGAQGIGMVHLDVAAADPDFFVSNCHKWLHVPRGCAVFYVPDRNQHLVASTVPTSHGYVPRSGQVRYNPLPKSKDSQFVTNFGFNGTFDNSPNMCVKHSIEWRKSLGGEDKILDYLQTLAKNGGKKIAAILGTFILDNKTETLTKCAMINVALPMVSGPDAESVSVGSDGTVTVPETESAAVGAWLVSKLMGEYQTFLPIYRHDGRWWVRVSAQIFLDESDFEWTGNMLKSLCERVGKQEYKTEESK